jgi:hypothetical protein
VRTRTREKLGIDAGASADRQRGGAGKEMLEPDDAPAELLAQEPAVELRSAAWAGDAEVVRRILVEELDLPRLVRRRAVGREQDRYLQVERVVASARGAPEPRLAFRTGERLPTDGAGEEIQDFDQRGKGTPLPSPALSC